MVVVSELVTGAVFAGAAELRLRFDRAGDVLRIEVDEVGGGAPPPDWLGLHLVASLTPSCGTRRHHDGRTLWADVRV